MVFLAKSPRSAEAVFFNSMMELTHRELSSLDECMQEQNLKTHRDLLNRYDQPAWFEHMNFDHSNVHTMDPTGYPPSSYEKIAQEGFYGAFYKYNEDEVIFTEWHELACVLAGLLRDEDARLM